MEDTWDLGAGIEEPFGVGDAECSDSQQRNWRDPPRPRPPCVVWWGWEAWVPITEREVVSGREEVGGGRSSPRAGKPFTWRRAPASLVFMLRRRDCEECES